MLRQGHLDRRVLVVVVRWRGSIVRNAGPVCTLRFSGFGFRGSGFGFRSSGFGFRVRVSGFGFRVSGFGFQVSGFGFRVSGFGFRISGFGFRISGFGFRVQGKPATPASSNWDATGASSPAMYVFVNLRNGNNLKNIQRLPSPCSGLGTSSLHPSRATLQNCEAVPRWARI